MALLIGVAFVAGCTMQKTRLEMDYGTSHKLAKYNQILDPDAEKNLDPVEGLSGKAAKGVMDRYEKGFQKAEQPTNTFTFNIGK